MQKSKISSPRSTGTAFAQDFQEGRVLTPLKLAVFLLATDTPPPHPQPRPSPTKTNLRANIKSTSNRPQFCICDRFDVILRLVLRLVLVRKGWGRGWDERGAVAKRKTAPLKPLFVAHLCAAAQGALLGEHAMAVGGELCVRPAAPRDEGEV